MSLYYARTSRVLTGGFAVVPIVHLEDVYTIDQPAFKALFGPQIN